MAVSHDSETPAVGQQVITACAFVHHNFSGVTKLFLPRRATTKKFLPDIFELPGGHIDFGEDIVSGLKREFREEFQRDIKVGDPFATFTYENTVKGSHSIEVIFFATFMGPIDDIKLNPADHSEFRWITETEVDLIEQAGPEEVAVIARGFQLLSGTSLDFGR